MTTASQHDEYRLPRTVVPNRYSITVVPDAELSVFEGEVAIELTVREPTPEIVLNAVGLEISSAHVRGGDGAERPLGIEPEERLERVRFVSDGVLPEGPAVLTCTFSGPINDRLCGFYRSRFTDTSGREREIASTHFEATDARRAFPCFDEPGMKAVFSVTLEVPAGLVAVSNAPEKEVVDLGEGRRRIVFEDTMVMSSYLVAYCIGPFELSEPVVAEGVPIRAVVPEGSLRLTSFALEAAAHALSWYQEYFGIAYPAEKLDLVAIPDFAMGAMENLGCVTFREQDLLCDPEDSSISELALIAEVVEHEIAHMWFGDLVTMGWWNGIWLNEAFATFMSLLCLDDFRPGWHRWVQFGVEKDLSLQVDGLHATRAIEFPVRAPDEADAMFDNLTYLKGGSVLRMVEQYLGPERFRDGVRRYLAEHAYANTETTDLWDALEGASGGEPVRAMLDTWIFQGGHPLLTASLEQGELTIRSEPFSYLPESERPPSGPPSAIGDGWIVPVRIEDRPGESRSVLLRPEEAGDGHRLGPVRGLPVVDAGGTGVYRLRYEGELLDRVLAGLTALEPLERFNLLADSWASALAQRSELSDFLALLARLGPEREPSIWSVVAGAVRLIDFAAEGEAGASWASFVRRAARPALDALGLEVGGDDSPEDQESRALLVRLLGTTGRDEEVIAWARQLFERRRAGAAFRLPASVAQSVLHVVVSTGARDEFDAVREGYRHPADPLSETRHLYALTSARHLELVAELLEMTLGEIRTQDGHRILARLLANKDAGEETFSFVRAHYDELERRLPPHAMPTVVGGAALLVQLGPDGRALHLEELRHFVASHDFGGHQRLVDQALERQTVNARFVSAARSRLAELLAKA